MTNAPTDQRSDNLDDNWDFLSDLPGNPMMWLLIISELLVFGAAFIGLSVARLLQPELFAQSQDALHHIAGGINTLVLVTSGFFAALGVAARAEGARWRARLWLFSAMLLGAVFLAVKTVEFGDLAGKGIDIDTNGFFTLYFLTTGFHAIHVVFGILILAIVARKDSPANLETGAAFWHMVDLIWVILYPLVYLVR